MYFQEVCHGREDLCEYIEKSWQRKVSMETRENPSHAGKQDCSEAATSRNLSESNSDDTSLITGD